MARTLYLCEIDRLRGPNRGTEGPCRSPANYTVASEGLRGGAGDVCDNHLAAVVQMAVQGGWPCTVAKFVAPANETHPATASVPGAQDGAPTEQSPSGTLEERISAFAKWLADEAASMGRPTPGEHFPWHRGVAEG